jgi:uncharacterized membrane-anchored protein YhcB (DUF1043 family)
VLVASCKKLLVETVTGQASSVPTSILCDTLIKGGVFYYQENQAGRLNPCYSAKKTAAKNFKVCQKLVTDLQKFSSDQKEGIAIHIEKTAEMLLSYLGDVKATHGAYAQGARRLCSVNSQAPQGVKNEALSNLSELDSCMRSLDQVGRTIADQYADQRYK